MKRPSLLTLNAATALSLLLCAASVALLAREYRIARARDLLVDQILQAAHRQDALNWIDSPQSRAAFDAEVQGRANLRRHDARHVLTRWPLLLLLISLPLPLLSLGLAVRNHLRDLARQRAGLCPGCGYDLRATPDRCPECGAVPKQASKIVA